MNAHLSDLNYNQSKAEVPPILIAHDSERSLTRAVEAVEASGIRIADQVAIEAASERIERQVASSACGSSSSATAASRWTGCSTG